MIGRGHLRESSNRWQGSVVDGKTDISPEDALCIDILIDYLANKEDFELAALLSNWKKDSDDKFINKLKDFVNFNTLDRDSENNEFTERKGVDELDFNPTLIEIGGSLFSVDAIDIIKTGDGWSKEKERHIHYYEINPKELCNRKLTIRREFVLEEHRDIELEELKMKLKEYGIKFI